MQFWSSGLHVLLTEAERSERHNMDIKDQNALSPDFSKFFVGIRKIWSNVRVHSLSQQKVRFLDFALCCIVGQVQHFIRAPAGDEVGKG